ncbi:MAG: hypothetical protein COV75_03345 [Candidatus Omnitrophica bacterium CG11_big_fil_rev_8_21_14_0_20_63_9]|nr:MAG: hypothetical protein COV75_03345 [Candidatus Omnitrophica bacterium CG11_big_fil_rev_8_21_14_0_20_63_9]
MAAQSYRLLRTSVTVFKVLAWVALVLQSAAGLFLLIAGGDPVLVAGAELDARIVGLLNIIGAGVYFYSLWLMAHLIRLMLDIRDRLPGG